MKIQNISFYNNYRHHVENFEKNKSSNKELGFIASPLEFWGRSQITFNGNILNNDDKKFVDVVSRDLRFNAKQKEKFTDIISQYLKENKIKSLDEIDCKGDDEQANLLNKISEKMDLSDPDFDVLSFHIVDRMYCEGIYLPEDRRFIKDLPVIEQVLQKSGLDDDVIDVITDSLLIDADILDCETLFDVFNKHIENIDNTSFYDSLTDELNSDETTNTIIDLCLKAKQYEKYGDSIFPKHEERVRFYSFLDDEFITDNILKEFNIDESEDEKIFNCIVLRHDNVSLQQIGFQIADKYNLPEKADKKIIEIIQNQKKLSQKLNLFDE